MNQPIDISGVTLRTQRLVLRPWRQSDLEDFYEYASVDGVGQMAGWAPHENKEKSLEILNHFIDGKRVFAMEFQGKVIGSLGVEAYSEEKFPEFADQPCREIGFVLSRAYWGRGLMPEAVREVIRWLFEEQGVRVLLCGHFTWNDRSRRVQEKCGFRFYKAGKYTTRMGTVEDELVNILTKEMWQDSRR